MQSEIIKVKLIDLYNRATLEQKFTGLNWYLIANKEARKLSKISGYSFSKVCGVISALSPNNKWERNLIDAALFLKQPSLNTKVCTYTANRVKALRILASEDFEVINILGGTKTKSFYDNIVNPRSDNVTIDLWMYRAAGLKQSNKNYILIANAIRAIALEVKLKPYQVQAILWGVIRDTKIVNEVINDVQVITKIAI